MCAPQRQVGFTLVEVLLALVLLALLMSGAYAALHASTRSVERGEALIDRTNKLRVAQEFLRRELSQSMALAVELDKATGESYMFMGEAETVTFVAPMPGYLGRGGAYVQRLSFEAVDGDTKLMFRHALHNGYKAEDEPLENPELEPVVLLENIREARFEYRAMTEDGTKLDDWAEAWEKKGRLPLLVRIAIEFNEDSRMQWPEMVVPLMIESAPQFRDPFTVMGGG